MLVNITDIRSQKTARGYPKVRFTVVFGERDASGTFLPKYQTEGWTILRGGAAGGGKKKDAVRDDRGQAPTELRLPQTPKLSKIEGMTYKLCGFATYQACDEELFEAIHQYMVSLKRVRAWLNLPHEDKRLDDTWTEEDGGFAEG